MSLNHCARSLVAAAMASAVLVSSSNAAVTPAPLSSFGAGHVLVDFEGGFGPITSFGGLGLAAGANPVNHWGTYIDNVSPFTGAPISITLPFATNRFAVDASFNSDNSFANLTFLLGPTIVGTALLNGGPFSSSPNPFVFGGFESTAAFDRVIIGGPSNGYLRLDNVRYAIPTPGAAMALSLGGLMIARRRR